MCEKDVSNVKVDGKFGKNFILEREKKEDYRVFYILTFVVSKNIQLLYDIQAAI